MSNMWRKLKKSLSRTFSSSATNPSSSSTTNDGAATTTTTSSSENGRSSSTTTSRRSSHPPLSLPPPAPSRSAPSSWSSRLSRSFSTSLSSSNTCAICLKSLKKGEGEAIFYAECSHPFHFKCIADNVKHGNLHCPLCRSKWKDLPFRASPSTVGRQRNPNGSSGQARVLPYNAPVPVSVEPEIFSDDEPLPIVPHILNVTSSLPQTLTIKSFPEFLAVGASDSLSQFGVLCRICAPRLDESRHQHRAPIDLVIVQDVSGSMRGKLFLVKRAINFIIQNLGPSDRVSIVTFSDYAQRILPLKILSESGREDAMNTVNSVSACGGTNIGAGLKKAVRILEERRESNPVASIILLSDGHDTHLSGRILRQLPNSICNRTGGSQLPMFPVHTFGFGSDHDATTMHRIADASCGTFSFIESIDILQEAFARCIGGLLSTVAQEVRLIMKSVLLGIQIESIPSGKYKNEISEQGHQASIDVGNLYAEEQKEFLVYLKVPASSGTTSLLDLVCTYKDPVSSNALQIHGERVEIQRRQNLSPADQIPSLEVDRQRNRVRVTEAIAEAQRIAETGDLKAAQALLSLQLTTLLSTVSAQAGDDLCTWLEFELREIKRRMESKEMYEYSGRAYLLSGMSSISWQRATTRGSNSNSNDSVSYETPSMTTMVTRSHVLSSAPGNQSPRLKKSLTTIVR